MAIRSHEIARLINEAVDAVERSKVGGLFAKDIEGRVLVNQGAPVYNIVGIQVLVTILQNTIPKSMDIPRIEEEEL